MKIQTIQSYKQKDFVKARRLAHQYIKSTSGNLNPNDRVVKIYFKVESDLSKMDFYLDKLYKQEEQKDPNIYKFIYYLLDKAYLGKDVYLAKKWGEIFLFEAGNTKFYSRGIFAYSGLLYIADEKSPSKKVLKRIPRKKMKKKWRFKYSLLKVALYKNEKKAIKQAKKYLSKYYESNHSDFVIAMLIQSYLNVKDYRNAKEWKQKLDSDFPDNGFQNEFASIAN
ncbi:MAG: hypothetical protein KDK36_12570 [Leptospiraceae bacterium]|nr:hypothetical protein [Leptospiraceae bacterium]